MGGSAAEAVGGADLPARWRLAVHTAGATAPADAVGHAGDDLLRRWAEPHRRYHHLAHLVAVLTALDVLAEGRPPAIVELAAWFHDAVYAGAPGADEQASAALAAQVLTALLVPAPAVDQVVRLVRMTADHRVGEDDTDGALLADADLAVLAADPAEYAAYADAVRAEYADVPQPLFAAGRTAVLAELLRAPTLFHTEAARARWERAARRNVTAELARLHPASPDRSAGHP